MTDDPPLNPGRSHSDAASRLAALLSEIEGTGAGGEVEAAEEPARPSEPARPTGPVAPAEPADATEPGSRDQDDWPSSEIVSVARKYNAPDPSPTSAPLTPRVGRAGLITIPTPEASPAEPGPVEPAPGAPGDDVRSDSAAASGNVQRPEHDPPKEAEVGDRDLDADVPRRRLRSKAAALAFGFSIVVLALSVPVLGYVGSQSLLTSKGGTFEAAVKDPTAPGYLAVVEPTPTALVIQRDKDDMPVALTLLSLGHGDDGGSVLFIPLDTNLIQPAFLIDRLRTVYSNGLSKGNDALFVRQVANLLNVGFTDVVNLHDDEWAQVVQPVAPIAVDNPDDVRLGNPNAGGMDFPKGPLLLKPEQVGPYLSAQSPLQDDLDRLARHKLFWEAWLKAISTSVTADAIPNTLTGIGPYVSTLAKGKVGIATLAVFPSAQQVNGTPTFQVDSARMRTQVAEAVPAPVSPGLGGRYSVRLLNGVDGEPIPDQLTATLVAGGAQINTKGNATVFGQETTRIEYHDANRRGTAIFVQRALGGGKVVADLSATDTVDLVITIGKDVLDR